MNKRLLILVVIVLFAPLNGNTTPIANEKPLVIIVKNKSIKPYISAIKGFNESLSKGGVVFRRKVYEWDDEFAIAEIKKLNPAIIFTLGTSVTQSVLRQVKQIPVVFSMVVDPANSRIKADNIAGISLDIPIRKQFQTFKEVVPDLRTLGVLYNPRENAQQIKRAHEVAQDLGLNLSPVMVNSSREIPAISSMHIDALWIIPDNTICQPPIIKRLLLSGLKFKIPVLGISAMYARAGALLALSCSYHDIGRQAGEMAGEIIKGAACLDMGIKQPREVKLYLNQAVADRLGINISRKILKRAEKVFGQ